MRDSLTNYLKYPRFRAIVLDRFAGLALLLAALDCAACSRERASWACGLRSERAAATWRDWSRCSPGWRSGMALTVALSRYLTSLLFEVSPSDPLATIAAPMALLAAALLAMAKPARDAVAGDPMVALRDE
jgi:hypothetical protein